MIDYQLRQKYSQQLRQQDQSTKFIKDAFSQVEEAVELKKDITAILEVLQKDQAKNHELFTKLGRAVALIFNKIPGKIMLPSIFKVKGQVEVSNPVTSVSVKNLPEFEKLFKSLEQRIALISPGFPSVSVDNLDEMGAYFKELNQNLAAWTQAAQSAPVPQSVPPKIEFPKINFPKQEKVDFSEVLDALRDLKQPSTSHEKSSDTAILRHMSEALDSFVSRPVMTPQPVTNVNVNALQGFMKTTSNTVGTTAVSLPNYGQLFNRRTLMIYNNSGNTIYYGGSDVTASNGIPVLASSFSSPIDAGYNMVIYGISAQANNNVRVVEVSKDQTQNIQE